jgi:hypothetical protein
MSPVTNYFEKLGSNFLVSAMAPSLSLVVACIFVFDPFLNAAHFILHPEGTQQLISVGVIISVFTIVIGFTLTALNTFILKMFEGYVTLPQIQFIYDKTKRMHMRKAHRLMQHRDKLKEHIRDLEGEGNAAGHENELEVLKVRYYQSAAFYNQSYPEDLADVLPTRFGNTLKAAENYTGERYGFDGVQMWPRLVHVIPKDYKESIDSVRNELSFLVNMSILSVIFAFLCVAAFFYTMFTIEGAGSNPAVYFDFLENGARYLLLAGVAFLIGRFFYNASIFSVGSFGLMVRSSFDLFRLDLLKKLGMKRPLDSIEEFEKWESLNELIVLGSHSLSFTKLDYRSEE